MPMNLKTAIMLIIGASVVCGAAAGLIIAGKGNVNNLLTGLSNFPLANNLISTVKNNPDVINQNSAEIKKFASNEEFKAYLEEAQKNASYGYYNGAGMGITGSPMANSLERADKQLSQNSPDAGGRGGGGNERYSNTNVQVGGVDEPDIVKTDGKQIYYAPNINYRIYYEDTSPGRVPVPLKGESGIGGMVPPYRQSTGETKIIKAFPPADLKQLGKISAHGNLLLDGNSLTIFSDDGRQILGNDVGKPESPEKTWKISFEDNTYLVAARMLDHKIYLVTATGINFSDPCPVKPMIVSGDGISIPCTEIYHPPVPTQADSTYTAWVVDPKTGKVENKTSFLAGSGSSVIYMSKNSLYISYPGPVDMFGSMVDFLKTDGAGLFPKELVAKFEKIASYDISDQSKMSEFGVLLQKFDSSLNSDERVKLENEIANRLSGYSAKHLRDSGKTGIVKIGLQDMKVSASGYVPGSPLNQFSMDEYQGNLRVAVTVGAGNLWGWGGGDSNRTANDVYILDGGMKITGSVKDLGHERERIYSVRFLEGEGYVVTFRQTDPFYVLDLRNPKDPKKSGELQIPGYSAYLDPIAKDRVLGVGQEGSQVKISLFDVSDPAFPKEVDKYLMKEYWTDVSSNHHAFLADSEKKIFFIPAGNNGYVFSYDGDKLAMKKAVSSIQARRAVYIGDYLYVLGDDKIVVVNEKDWERVNELKFTD